jgi:hypothetical protein
MLFEGRIETTCKMKQLKLLLKIVGFDTAGKRRLLNQQSIY